MSDRGVEWLDARAEALESVPELRPLDLGDFLRMEFPPRENLLGPWLPRQGLAMMFAPRGVGKTFVALHVAYAVASGGSLFGRWHAPAPAGVVYLDGEMPAAAMQERLAGIVAASDAEAKPGAFRLLTPDMHRDGMPNLANSEGQAAVDAALPEDTALIVVDNLSTLANGGKENEAESWLPVQQWALRHRAAGRSVLFVHHAGKGGAQRGTSRREDVLDTVLSLRRPAEYSPDQGAAFEVHFEKARGIHGEDVEPFEARLEQRGDRLEWSCRTVEDSTRERIQDLHETGLRPVDIASELDINRSTVSRHLRALGLPPNKGGAK